jgi:hypothetical protein
MLAMPPSVAELLEMVQPLTAVKFKLLMPPPR